MYCSLKYNMRPSFPSNRRTVFGVVFTCVQTVGRHDQWRAVCNKDFAFEIDVPARNKQGKAALKKNCVLQNKIFQGSTNDTFAAR